MRWGVGMPGSVRWLAECLQVLRDGDPRLRPYVVYVSVAANVLLNGLNLWWGLKIIDGVRKLLRGERRGTTKAE